MAIVKSNLLHRLFVLGIMIKGIHGLIEIAGGTLFLIMKSGSVTRLVRFLFQSQFAQGSTGFLADQVIRLSINTSIESATFAAMYLIAHGSIKAGIVAVLFSRKAWAYPLAGVLLSIFIIYQSVRFFFTHSLLLLALTTVDLMILGLLRHEYRHFAKG